MKYLLPRQKLKPTYHNNEYNKMLVNRKIKRIAIVEF